MEAARDGTRKPFAGLTFSTSFLHVPKTFYERSLHFAFSLREAKRNFKIVAAQIMPSLVGKETIKEICPYMESIQAKGSGCGLCMYVCVFSIEEDGNGTW